MLLDFSLKNIFDEQLQESSDTNTCALDRVIFGFFRHSRVDIASAIEALEETEEFKDPFAILEAWRKLFALNLLRKISRDDESLRAAISARASYLLRHPLWDGVQLAGALKAVNCHLLGIDYPAIEIQQDESGAVPFETGGHWSWAKVPHPRYLAELGLLWAWLGKEMGDDTFLQAAWRLAKWQINTLDDAFQPFVGFFTREEDASLSHQLVNNYLLFHSVALFAGDENLEYVADRQREYLWKLKGEGRLVAANSWALVLAAYLEKLPDFVEPEAIALRVDIIDEQYSAVGKRSSSQSVVAMLNGGGTSMGAYHRGDVSLVSFGPQVLPLGDCSGYGIEGIGEKASISCNETGFAIGGRARMTGVSTKDSSGAWFRCGDHSGVWFDAKQQLFEDKLTVAIEWMSVEQLENLAFAFFVKAQRCQVAGGMHIRPQSLDRYQGEPCPVTFSGSHDLTLETGQRFGQMQVVPLASDDSFWGADFLVAYHLESRCMSWHWDIH